ncbi:MAG: ATPase [Spirochaetia bacterium]|jgi:hypothetical protein
MISGTKHPFRVEVVEEGGRGRRGWLRCAIEKMVEFDTARMESYFFETWQPVLYDALLVASAVEFCDRTIPRPIHQWGRLFELSLPVHDPERWATQQVSESLHSALDFLTGDRWSVSFRPRAKPESKPRQGMFRLGSDVTSVIPFSDGIDSCAVAGILEEKLGRSLVKVRLGSLGSHGPERLHAFTSVPYRVNPGIHPFVETSARSRGFKFALVAGIAAYLAKADEIIVPESGQGALGPSLVPVGQVYEDYRSHPLFAIRMERLLRSLLGWRGRYVFPQLWLTKGETIAEFMKTTDNAGPLLAQTRSCWQQSRQSSVAGKRRQCGICAACMLRRMSMHATNVGEPISTYVWEDLSTVTFESGAATGFEKRRVTRAMREYAIAGTLHLDQLARLRNARSSEKILDLSAFQISRACELTAAEVRARLDRMLARHAAEWENFLNYLGPDSFVARWTDKVTQ